ncbi:TIGR03943 family protein [Neobacillus mesonae]|nr:TIGR03943 family protein [Neobacillus mesonae]
MNIKWNGQQLFRALILLLFSVMLFRLHITGDILKFVNPKYELLSLSAAILFAILFLFQIRRGWEPVSHEHVHHQDNTGAASSLQKQADHTFEEGHSTSAHLHEHHSCHDDHCHHDHGNAKLNFKKIIGYGIVLFPLATGFLVPPQVLNASIADKKGGMLLLTGSQSTTADTTQGHHHEEPNVKLGEEEHTEDEGVMENSVSKNEFNQLMAELDKNESIVMKERIFASYYDRIAKAPEQYAGRTIQLSGFVFREEGLPEEQLVISRFLITHCIADASLIGFLTEFSSPVSMEEDTWIEATGQLDTAVHNGTLLPIIRITEWTEIAAPDQPYVYPLSVRIL